MAHISSLHDTDALRPLFTDRWQAEHARWRAQFDACELEITLLRERRALEVLFARDAKARYLELLGFSDRESNIWAETASMFGRSAGFCQAYRFARANIDQIDEAIAEVQDQIASYAAIHVRMLDRITAVFEASNVDRAQPLLLAA
jgi:hypothetical protein